MLGGSMHPYGTPPRNIAADDFNPYRPPEANIDIGVHSADTDHEGVWRDGRDLVVLHDQPLPGRCVKCNAEAMGRLKTRKFHWHAPWLYLLILIGLLLYFIVALIARKSSRHAVALCATHARRRTALVCGSLAGFVCGLLLAFLNADMIGTGIFIAAVAILVGALGSRVLVPIRIDDRYTRFRGASRAFLDSLPALPAYRRR